MEKNKIDIKKMIRPACDGFEPYVAGKPVEAIQRELGLKKVIKLASNENPLGPSPKAKAALKKAIGKIFYYPDSNAWNIKSALAKKFGVDASQISLGAGSDELIEIIAEVFFKNTDEVIVSECSFVQYQRAGRLMDSKVITVPMKDFKHDLAAMAKAVGPLTKAVFIANPNNPTGTYNTKAEFDSFLNVVKQRLQGQLPLIIMDEAYYEFARAEPGYPETLDYLAQWPSMIILRTFSKIYGLAGLRVGYAFSSPEIISYMERVRPPFNVNSLAQIAGVASLDDDSQIKRSSALVNKGKEYLYEQFKKMNMRYIPSAANFVLVEVSPMKGKDVFSGLLKKGVIIRAMDEYNLPGYIRVSVGLMAENREFIKAFAGLKNGGGNNI